MKLRIRLRGQTKAVYLEETSSVETLRREIVSLFQLENEDFGLSLNGSDEIENTDSTKLKQLDIVHGDLIHVFPHSLEPDKDTSSAQSTLPTTSNTPGPASSPSRSSSSSNSKSCQPTSPPTYSATTSLQATPAAVPSTSSNVKLMEVVDDDDAIQDSLVNRYLEEPMLVNESTKDSVPQLLHKVYNNADVHNQQEAICVLLHVLMIESGYNLQGNNAATTGSSMDIVWMPSGWRSQSTYRLTYGHPSCSGVTFTLLVVAMGPVLVIHGRAAGDSLKEKCQVQVLPADYVTQVDSDAAKTYTNLAKFSRTFKDRVAYALIDLCRQARGEAHVSGLSGMLEDIKLLILSCLDARSLTRIALVSKDLCRISRQPQLWRRLYLRDFGRRTHMDLEQDWHKLYREKSVLRREMRERMNQARFVVPPFIERPDPPFPFTPVYPPGFIGGDYDRFPNVPGMPGAGIGPIPPLRPRFDPYGPFPDDDMRPGGGRGGIFEGFGRRPRPRDPFGGGGRRGGGGGFGGFF